MAFVLAASLHVAVAIASRHEQVPGVAPIDGQPDVTAVDLIDPPAPTTIPETSSVRRRRNIEIRSLWRSTKPNLCVMRKSGLHRCDILPLGALRPWRRELHARTPCALRGRVIRTSAGARISPAAVLPS